MNQGNFNQDNIVSQLIQQFNQAFAPGAQALGDEMQLQVRSALTSALQKMDLVTREEFDTQQAVLTRSREKLDALEQQIAELEETIQQLTDRQ
ncbi:MAG: accessory factor UbiK family protein [Porticoccaceae bacterium]